MSLSVTVLTPHGRRHVVRCAPDTTLLKVLEQTCEKFQFKPDEYDLTHHNRVLDLTLVMRFSGLPNNAALEMSPIKIARIESDVGLALQLEDGSRLMGTYKPSVNVYDILVSLVPDQIDETLYPVVIYMRNRISGIKALQETTLKSLGLTGGKAILRFVNRSPEQLNTQANVTTPLVQKPKEKEIKAVPMETVETKSEECVVVKIAEESESVTEIQKDADVNVINSIPKDIEPDVTNDVNMDETNVPPTNKSEEVGMDCTENNSIEIRNELDDNKYNDEIIILGERNALVFSQIMSNELPLNDLPDEFYDLTVSEVKKLFFDLGKKRQELENAPLKTEHLRNIEINDKVQTRKNEKVVLRILFPDRTVLQGTFVPIDKIQIVKDFVQSYLQHCNQPFDLYVTPPKQILSPGITLMEAGCVPSAILHFGPRGASTNPSNYQYLREDIFSKLTTPEAALFSASQSRGIKKSDIQDNFETSETSGSGEKVANKRFVPFSVSGPSSSAKNKNVPKWFKMNQ